ncbi:comF family protein [Cardinium endosymbiont of Sogatella furcifera]|uniref:ComF family protein n=1 Tax=Cardinium endosymbiont of Sogatella furcifera TaxID=650378 RepID=UPI000E0D65A2|nr:ComF family protein [Cardinium endosymbiont of Sogatella furcifera]AXI24263.1 comF family protein [Cardinium endosymbiont of Sogatella furcifera]AXI24449.1 comF family protein [Cardinium endosymbiont of Sogatella furcifera]
MMKRLIAGLLDLFFPPLCVGCNHKLIQGETWVCTICLSAFPETNAHTLVDNLITNYFIGKVTIAYGFSLYKLRKKSHLEQVLFAMKYKNQPKIGQMLGQRYGQILHQAPMMPSIDGIVAVPLHPKRLKERGYNQSDFFAKGLSAALNMPLYTACIARTRYTPSQTTKNKIERIANLKDAFKVIDAGLLAGKHLLLVDDILTTGATLTACTHALLAAGVAQVSIATIAVVEA